jgi:uncharacterized protein
MNIVSNTGPLIALAKADQLRLLESLFGQVHIPPAVHRELLAKSGVEAERLDQAFATFIRVVEHPEPTEDVRLVTLSLDRGEQAAIALAHQMSLTLLMDDRLGRQAARRLNLPVMGTVGVLLKAKQEKLIPLIRPVLEQIRDQGYWLSDELIAIATKFANE